MRERFGLRAAVACAAVALTAQLSCATAQAAQGIALDTGRIAVETPLVAGKSYQLAKLSVRNPGDLRTKYDLVVTPIQTDAITPQTTWISFSPKQVTVQPGRQQAVSVSIRIPKNAAPGRYEVLVGARVAPSDNGMAIAAGAAARLTFSVAGASSLEAIVTVMPAWWQVPTVAAVGAGAWLGRRKLRLRIPFERR